MSDLALNDFIDSNDIDYWTISDIVKCEQYFQLDHNDFICRLYGKELINAFADYNELFN
jgi:hypothetical protein